MDTNILTTEVTNMDTNTLTTEVTNMDTNIPIILEKLKQVIYERLTVYIISSTLRNSISCISHLHTKILIYILVFQVLCSYGTICLRTSPLSLIPY